MNEREAADVLYSYLAETSEDLLEEYWQDNYPMGYQKYFDDYMDPIKRPGVEHWQEVTYRRVMGELAFMVLERSLGRHEGREVEL